MTRTPDTEDAPTAEAAYLAALERLWAEVGREPIGALRRETAEAWTEARKARNRMRYRGRRGGTK